MNKKKAKVNHIKGTHRNVQMFNKFNECAKDKKCDYANAYFREPTNSSANTNISMHLNKLRPGPLCGTRERGRERGDAD